MLSLRSSPGSDLGHVDVFGYAKPRAQTEGGDQAVIALAGGAGRGATAATTANEGILAAWATRQGIDFARSGE
jgi:hypothetical protein